MTHSANGIDEVTRAQSDLAFVTIKHEGEWLFEGHALPVLHDTGQHVWVSASYADKLPDEVKQVGDGRDNGYDANGGKVVSVPADWCTFLNEEDATSIEMMIETDQRLLSYAR